MILVSRVRLVVGILFCFSSAVFSQIPNDFGYVDYKERFPKESFIFLDVQTNDVFDITKNGLEMYSNFEESLMCLDYNAIGLKDRSVGYSQFTEIEDIEAYSLYPENGKYKKLKVKEFKNEQVISNGNSFYDDSREVKYQYENLKEGTVTYLGFKRKFKDPHLLHSRSFSSSLFIKNEIYSIKVHKEIDLGFHVFNMEESNVKYTTWEEGEYLYHKWETSDSEKEVIYGNEYYDLYYEPHIIPYIKSYQLNGETVSVFRNLDDLYAWYRTLVNQIEPSTNKDLKILADSIVANAENDLEKVKRIYYWVQDKIKYIAFGDGYGGFVPRDPDLIFERRFGDCKDMTCLTVSLLKELDIDAYFTWVGTRKIPYSYSEVFDPSVDNHMIATYLDRDGKKYFLDATDPDLEFGRPAYSIQGKEVLIGIDDSLYKIDSVAILLPSENSEFDIVELELNGNKIIGQGSFLFTGYLAEDVYSEFNNVPKDELIKNFNRTLYKGSNKFSATEVDYFRPNESKDSLQIDYNFEIESYVNSIGENLYLNLNLTKQFKEYKFDEKQNVPVILEYRNYLEKQFYFKIPSDYSVDYLPEDVSFENEFIKYSISYEVIEEKIDYRLKFEQKVIFLSVEQVVGWNEAIKKMSLALDESIKLKKQ